MLFPFHYSMIYHGQSCHRPTRSDRFFFSGLNGTHAAAAKQSEAARPEAAAREISSPSTACVCVGGVCVWTGGRGGTYACVVCVVLEEK
jgi:hypothetical protein